MHVTVVLGRSFTETKSICEGKDIDGTLAFCSTMQHHDFAALLSV
jgi:hypothetical protein